MSLGLNQNWPTMRILTVLFFTFSAIYWLLFAISQYPLVVAPDHNDLTVYEHSAAASAWLFLLSLIAIWLPTGFFGRGKVLLGMSLATVFGWLVAAVWLFPTSPLTDYARSFSVNLLGAIFLIASCVKLIACSPAALVPGLHPGAIQMSDDFYAPLDDDFWTGTT